MLDIKTRLNLKLYKANIVEHIKVEERDKKIKLNVSESNMNDVFIFDNYEEYVNYFKMFIDTHRLDNKLIDLAIHIRGKRCQIVALKSICETIIINRQIKEFYESYNKKK